MEGSLQVVHLILRIRIGGDPSLWAEGVVITPEGFVPAERPLGHSDRDTSRNMFASDPDSTRKYSAFKLARASWREAQGLIHRCSEVLAFCHQIWT